MDSLVRWLAEMQGSYVDLGGFRGRTNKLVDGCYSWWVGGCFPLVEGLLELEKTGHAHASDDTEKVRESDHESDWDDADGAYPHKFIELSIAILTLKRLAFQQEGTPRVCVVRRSAPGGRFG